MKKIYLILLSTLLLTFNLVSAQQCVRITTETFYYNPSPDQYSYYGVKVTLDKTYDQDIFVEGGITSDGTGGTVIFGLTVTAGTLSAQTSGTYYQTDALANVSSFINRISPDYVTSNNVLYYNQCNTSSTAYRMFLPNSVTFLTDNITRSKIISTFFNPSDNIDPNVTFNYDSMQLITFTDGLIQAVLMKEVNFLENTSHNHILFVYVNGEQVSDMAMECTVDNDLNGNKIAHIFDANGFELCTYKATPNGDLFYTYNPITYSFLNQNENYFANNNILSDNLISHGGPSEFIFNSQRAGYWERWASCVSTGLSQMTNNKRPVQVAAGLGIMAMGWIGAAGAALGCAAHAAVFH